MPRASELKRGSYANIEGQPHEVEHLQTQTPSARGGSSLYKVRFRNLVTRHKVDKTFKGDDMLDDADFDRREVQFLYKQGDAYTFMDLTDYSQFTLSGSDLEEQVLYLVDDMEGIIALRSGSQTLAIEMPPVVELLITACDPSMRGASATSRTKPATLVTGLVVQVPEYLAPETVIRVDTRTGKFISRA